MRRRTKFLIRFGLIFGPLMMIMSILSFIGLFKAPDLSLIDDQKQMSILYDENNTIVKEYCTYCREITTLDKMGHFPKLAIAVEDKTFETRWLAFDVFRIVAATYHNTTTGKIKSGASGIPQQVARNTFLIEELKHEWNTHSLRAVVWRKLRETWITFILWKHFRKDRWRILELYLNTANCGGNVYGVVACSRHRLNKEAQELTIGEAAWIIGLWRSPQYGKLEEYQMDGAWELRERVLTQIKNADVITDQQKKEFDETPLPIARKSDPCDAAHAAEFARQRLTKNVHVVDQGLKVRLTINCNWQNSATRALRESMEAMKSRNPELHADLRGGVIVMERTGDIKVFVQEPSFYESQVLLDDIQRHAGSTAKVFALLAYLINGGKLSCKDEGSGRCTLNDTSGISIYVNKTVGRKFIKNFPYQGLPRYRGTTEVILCMAESRNACFMSMIKGVGGGVDMVSKDEFTEILVRLGIKLPLATEPGSALIRKDLARKLGIDENSVDPGYTGAIGSVDISLLEMARAWSGLMGELVEPQIIKEIIDASGEPLVFQRPEPVQIIENILTIKRLEAKRQQRKHEIRSAQPEIYRKKEELEKLLAEVQLTDQELKIIAIDADKIKLALLRGLRAPVEFPHGTAKLARMGDEEQNIPKLDFQVCGKTGTATNQQGETTDNWFVGCTSSHIMAGWIGRDKKLPMKTIGPDGKEIQETGGKNLLPVFIKVAHEIYKTHPKGEFPPQTDPTKPLVYTQVSESAAPLTQEKEKTQEKDSINENNS